MGMFTKAQKNMATGVYADIKKCLKEKDGFTHVVMVNSFGKLANQNFMCEDKYSTEIDHKGLCKDISYQIQHTICIAIIAHAGGK